MIVDLFAGPGGWDEGLRLLGRTDVLGVEFADSAVATRYAAGHKTWQTDIAAVTDDQIRALADGFGPIEGLVASPPCQGFSMAGSRKGLDDIADLRRAIAACKDGWVELAIELVDDRSHLVLEPLRWAWLLQPEWIACEQVPGVLPLWDGMASILSWWGYSTFVKVLNAADYGVPQIRKRAILMAKRGPKDWLNPEPTHSKKGTGGRKKWVTMAEALGWGLNGTPEGGEWTENRPATTVACDPRVFRPGAHRANDGRRSELPGRSEGAIRIQPWQALVLQSFRRDYPVQGARSRQFEQIGNAVPPLMAKAILQPLLQVAEGAL